MDQRVFWSIFVKHPSRSYLSQQAAKRWYIRHLTRLKKTRALLTSLHTTSMTIMITSTKEDNRDRIPRQKKEATTTTCLPLRDLFSNFVDFRLSHGSRAAATSRQSSQEDIRRGEQQKESTSGEETTTYSSHLGSQCSTNIGALQHHDHYSYNRCTSCDDISEDGDILATCLHLYDVDIKDGGRMLHAQPPTTTTSYTYRL